MNNFDKRLTQLEERKAAQAVDNEPWVVSFIDPNGKVIGRHYFPPKKEASNENQ